MILYEICEWESGFVLLYIKVIWWLVGVCLFVFMFCFVGVFRCWNRVRK